MKKIKTSERGGGFLIPPLPTSKKLSEKEGKARSPLGNSPKKMLRLSPLDAIESSTEKRFPYTGNRNIHEQDKSPSFSYLMRYGSYKTDKENEPSRLGGSVGVGVVRGDLAPLPFSKHINSTGRNHDSKTYKDEQSSSLPRPSSLHQRSTPSIAATSKSIISASAAANGVTIASTLRSESVPLAAAVTQREAGSSLTARPRVLRYRETMESLFCLTSESSEEHRQLCCDIVDGHLVDDPGAWCRVLEFACDQEQKQRQSPGHKSRGRDLLRLHRRATSRFPLENYRNDQFNVFQVWLSYAKAVAILGSTEDCRLIFQQMHDYNVGSTCASYYLALADFEGRQDKQLAKKALLLGVTLNAQPTEELLKSIKKIDNCCSDGYASGRASRRDAVKSPSSSHFQNSDQQPLVSILSDSGRLTRKFSPQKKRDNRDIRLVSKRLRTEKGCMEVTVSAESQRAIHEDEDDKGRNHICSDNRISTAADEVSLTLSEASDNGAFHASGTSACNNRGDRFCNKKDENSTKQEEKDSLLHLSVPYTKRNTNNAASKSSSPFHPYSQGREGASGKISVTTDNSQSGMKYQSKLTSSREVEKETDNHRDGSQSSSKKQDKSNLLARTANGGGHVMNRLPLLSSKTPRLARVGLRGKAQRVGTESSVAFDSDSDDSDGSSTKEPSPLKEMTSTTNSVTKLTKMNLNYILDWKPDKPPIATNENHENKENRHGKSSGAETKKTCALHKVTNNLPALPNSSAPAAHASNDSGHSFIQPTLSASTTKKSVQSTDSEQSERSELSTTSSKGSHLRSSGRNDNQISPSTAKLIGDSNPDFLPLVSENNIIRVNNVPYVKLGVVGKGGSSKVYRALTKDCTVLAIKKVKLKGMDRKTTDGYANEISLLKRLRNNPAIIQMYDSEVDKARKAIFVVMEAGEIDLNGVLQQQHQQATLSGAKLKPEGSKSLDINFIRLTWQQMLSAVHCIHEERIIHGDLKPANFLFVRGALKLIDFGIAKAIQSEDTTNIYRESQVGTVNYMCPEAILATKPGSQKWKCGRASDIWSLGCILYQMVYGRTPFASLHLIQKLQAIVDPDHQISFPHTVEEAAIDAMRKCLHRKPEDRPPIVGKDGLLNEHPFLNSSRSLSPNLHG